MTTEIFFISKSDLIYIIDYFYFELILIYLYIHIFYFFLFLITFNLFFP